MNKTITKAALAVASVGVGLALAGGTAQANTTDDIFIQVLHEQGIAHANGDSTMISAGHGVCNSKYQGYSDSQVVSYVHSVSSLDWFDSGFFVGASIASYCPAYMS